MTSKPTQRKSRAVSTSISNAPSSRDERQLKTGERLPRRSETAVAASDQVKSKQSRLVSSVADTFTFPSRRVTLRVVARAGTADAAYLVAVGHRSASFGVSRLEVVDEDARLHLQWHFRDREARDRFDADLSTDQSVLADPPFCRVEKFPFSEQAFGSPQDSHDSMGGKPSENPRRTLFPVRQLLADYVSDHELSLAEFDQLTGMIDKIETSVLVPDEFDGDEDDDDDDDDCVEGA